MIRSVQLSSHQCTESRILSLNLEVARKRLAQADCKVMHGYAPAVDNFLIPLYARLTQMIDVSRSRQIDNYRFTFKNNDTLSPRNGR